MSKELSILARCSHEIKEETTPLLSDRRTLETVQPIASDSSVQIIVNNDTNLIIPQSGLFSSARVTGMLSGPFKIYANSNQLTIDTQSETLNLNLPPGSRLNTDAIVRLVRSNSNGIGAYNTNGYLTFEDNTDVGKRSRIKISGSSAEALGFSDVNGSMGKTLYPSWRLVKTSSSSEKVIQFSTPVKKNPLFRINYTANPNTCLRCASTRIENDWIFDTSGQSIIIENEDLLHQAAVKIVFTEKGSNIFHPFYGTDLTRMIGSKAISSVANIINEDVRRALVNMQNLQRAQSRYQLVTFKEQLLSIDSVRTTQDPNNLNAFNVEVVIRNASTEPITLNVYFTLPQIGRF